MERWNLFLVDSCWKEDRSSKLIFVSPLVGWKSDAIFFYEPITKRSYVEGREGGAPNPISQEIVFFKSQLKSHNPSLCCSNWYLVPIFLLFFFMNPSPSAQNPISQPLKKANPSSQFTPSRPST